MQSLTRCSVAIRSCLILLLICVWAGPAAAQPDPNLPSTFGSVKLKAGFADDPHKKALVAGGPLKTNLGGVNAFVADAPDFRVEYTAGQYPLTFHVKSRGDTTLLINLPDGSWVADDDSGGGLDPLIRIAKPQSGRYDVYVGTFNEQQVAATLFITERNPVTKPQPPPVPIAANLPDCHIVSAGVDNYPFVKRLNGDLNDARNTVAAFKSQEGIVFRSVKVHRGRALLDGDATHRAIHEGFKGLTNLGTARDLMVLFVSGHGGRSNSNKNWYFCPFDFHPGKSQATALTDQQILEVGDELVRQRKNVLIIVDACFSGQLYTSAKTFLKRYQASTDGGMILMLASSADQESNALGNYSAFARAFADAMAGGADRDKDGRITLASIKRYATRRTGQLLAEARVNAKQDPVVVWSPSVSSDMPLAYRGGPLPSRGEPQADAVKLARVGVPTQWEGKETLSGFGALTFKTYPSGLAVMVDAKSTTDGVWRKDKNQITLTFANGTIVYTGTLEGNALSGTATAPGSREQAARSWTWSVTKE